MAVRYSQEILNFAGVYFKIEILDENYSGSVNEFLIANFEIDYKSQTAGRDGFLIGSECVVIALSTDDYDISDLMEDIRTGEEGQFTVVISKKKNNEAQTTYKKTWVGTVLGDLSGGEDSGPVQQFEIVAVDGIGILKGIDYSVDSETPYGDATAATHLINALKKIPVSVFASTDIFLKAIVRLYESNMDSASGSTIAKTQIPAKTFYTYENETYSFKSCYDVLQEICVLFKSRLFFANGHWNFYELYSLENEASVRFIGFQYNGTEKTYGLVTWQNITNVTIYDDNKIVKTGGANLTWDAGALSDAYLVAGQSGWVEFTVLETNTVRMCGLAAYNTSTAVNSINYAIRVTETPGVQILELGTIVANVGSYAANDVFKIERVGTTIKYYKNGSLLYTSLVASTQNLYADCGIRTPNAALYNVIASWYDWATIRTELTGGFSGGNRLAGQRFEWLPALKEVKQIYKHFSSDNLLDVAIDSDAGQQRVVDSIVNTGEESLLLSAQLNLNVIENPLVGLNKLVFVKLRLLFKVGIWHYVRPVTNQNQNNDYSAAVWQTVPGYIEFIAAQTVNYSGNNIIPISFETPALLQNNAPLDMNLEIVYVQDLQQNDISGDYNIFANLVAPYLEYIDGEAENERIYRAFNDTTAFFSAILEFPDAHTADRINPMTPNNLKVWNGSAWVETEGEWKRNALNGTTPLLQLTLNEFLAGQRKFIKKRQGEFVGKFEAMFAIGVSGEYYLPLSVRYSANDAIYDGEWYQINEFDDNGIEIDDTPVTILSVAPPSVSIVAAVNQTLPTGVLIENNHLAIEDDSRNVAIDFAAGQHNYFIDSVGIGSDTKYPSAIVSIDSTERGFLLPRMTQSQRDAIASPEIGLMIYQTNATAGVYVYSGSGWDKL